VLYGQFARSFSFQNATRINSDLTICLHKTFAEAHQPAGSYEFWNLMDGWYFVSNRQLRQPLAVTVEEGITADY